MTGGNPEGEPRPLEERVILEQEVSRLRERTRAVESQAAATVADAEAARTLASGADHDVSEVRAELRAHTQTLNALRETQREMGQEVREMDRRIEDRFVAVDVKLASVKTGVDHIIELLEDRGRDS